MTEFLSTRDATVGRIASRQHGVVTAAQLDGTGIDKDGIAWRVRTGRIHRLHRGVYAVGHRSLSWRGRWLAAVLAAGDGAVLSHTSAAALWRFLGPVPGPVHITLAAAVRRRPRAGIQIHRSRTLAPSHITRCHGIALTTPARTIEDIRTAVEPYLFRRALRQAELAGHRLVVETDSWEYHRGSVAMEDDRERDLELRAQGIEVRRYTGEQIEGAPDAVAADLRDQLTPAGLTISLR